jgi:S-adenosylmethionine/arginine decarboxylase-like enzyme
MESYGDLVIARFGEDIEKGISAVQLITTSSITIHTNDMTGDCYLDVFNCKWFDETAVEQLVQYYFNPVDIKTQVILRK